MSDIRSSGLMWFKAVLFLLLGMLASTLILIHTPSATVAALQCLSVWAFCRFYYFAFYVIQHYVDDEYRFSGLLAFVHYALTTPRHKRQDVA